MIYILCVRLKDLFKSFAEERSWSLTLFGVHCKEDFSHFDTEQFSPFFIRRHITSLETFPTKGKKKAEQAIVKISLTARAVAIVQGGF